MSTNFKNIFTNITKIGIKKEMCALYVVTIPSLSPYELETLVQTKCQEFTDVLDKEKKATTLLERWPYNPPIALQLVKDLS